MKNAYILVTDLHYAVRKEHRVNYFGEVMGILQEVIEIGEKYRTGGYNPILVLLGDVVDGPIRDPEEAMRAQDILTFVAHQFSSVYCVVGNHEENFIANNPFWFLVASLGDEALNSLPRAIQPLGIDDVFRIGSILRDGDTTFYFNHYGISPKTPTGEDKVAIGLFHQNVGSNQITKMWGAFDDVETVAYVKPYNYCFFGHMHLADGKYYIDAEERCLCEWLGACVGTTVVEVEELDKKLNIPAVIVEDGHFIRIEDNKVNRSNPKDVIDIEKLKITKATKEFLQEVKEAGVGSIVGDSLFEQVMLTAKDEGLDSLTNLLTENIESVLFEYRKELNQELVSSEETEG